MRKTFLPPLCCLVLACVGAVVVCGTPALLADDTNSYPITCDTYIDSQQPTFNWGLYTSAKVVVNGQTGSQSLTRVLFTLPDEALTISPGSVKSAKVRFYPTGDLFYATRNVELRPLTQGFSEGTGSTKNGSATGNGATWYTSNGSTGWDSPDSFTWPSPTPIPSGGGTYDHAESDPPLGTIASGWYTWDITSLWANSNLRSFGAMLKMSDESDPGNPNMPRVTFASSDYSTASLRPVVEITTVPEPSTCAMLVAGACLFATGFSRRWTARGGKGTS